MDDIPWLENLEYKRPKVISSTMKVGDFSIDDYKVYQMILNENYFQ